MADSAGVSTPEIELADGHSAVSNVGLFFKRWLANPLQMGSVIPSSRTLCRKIAAQVEAGPDEVVVELGAGTGVVSQALLARGFADRLFVVEIVPEMARHLRGALPGAHVIEGDARQLPALIPAEFHGKIATIVCGVPLILLPLPEQRRFIDAMEAVAPGRGFLQFTYWVGSPLKHEALGLEAERVAFTPMNFPPASVWRYRRKA